MKGLSIIEADGLFPAEGVDVWIERLRRILPRYGNAFSVQRPVGRTTALAQFLGSRLFSNEAGCLVYITETGIFPSSEHFDLFDTYRMGAGEKRSLEAAPIQRFSSEEDAAMISILCMILYFSWNAEIASMDEHWLITISHDNWIEIRMADTALIKASDYDKNGILIPF